MDWISVFRIRIIFDADPDPLPGWWIRIRIRPKIEQIPIFFFLISKRCFFVVLILSLLFAYIKQNKWFLFKKLYFYNFGWFVCEFITIITRIQINVSGSGSGQMIRIRPNPDPDPKHCWLWKRREVIYQIKMFNLNL